MPEKDFNFMQKIVLDLEFTKWVNEYTDRLDSVDYEVRVCLLAETELVAELEVERLRYLSLDELHRELKDKHKVLPENYDELTYARIENYPLRLDFETEE